MILIDTSIWIELFRDKSGRILQIFRKRIKNDYYAITRFTQIELLQGARDEADWQKLEEYLESQLYIEATEKTWRNAARIYFELRRKGLTINSPIDCLIAEIAIESGSLLIHRDKDFIKISKMKPLDSEYLELHK